MPGPRKSFIDFVLEAQKDPEIAKAFMRVKTTRGLKSFFVKVGYGSLAASDLSKILNAKKNLENRLMDGFMDPRLGSY